MTGIIELYSTTELRRWNQSDDAFQWRINLVCDASVLKYCHSTRPPPLELGE